ncbi:MAG: viperin family antiviral radical SAM protein, partial [Bacteroidales bacterium]|nr:viperin family antiviral radical SAM protein [Bacteroidales bacterium]
FCSFLPNLLEIAKKGGMTTMIVTNGSKLDFNWLQSNSEFLDWIALSVDSVNKKTNSFSGRYHGKQVFDKLQYLSLIKAIKHFGYKLKINTVVSSFNFLEDMNEFINKVNPDRWKIMQALPIKGQNDNQDFEISLEEFNAFLKRHQKNQIVSENNYEMQGSYVMIDPIGRFFDNSKGKYVYSSKINTVGIKQAMNEVNYCFKKFINRDGIYEWK